MQYNRIFSVEEKTVLITGSSRGIGFVLARAFASLGAKVILNGRTRTTLEQASSSLNALGYQTFTSLFDVDDQETVEKEVSRIEKNIGPVDILINNAGIQRRHLLKTSLSTSGTRLSGPISPEPSLYQRPWSNE